MARIFPLDELITDEWYPGYDPAQEDSVVAFDRPRTFTKEDEAFFWPLDFHEPRGMVPLAIAIVSEGPGWGSGVAAEAVGLPATRGLRGRFVGPHVYATDVPVTSAFEIGIRAQRVQSRMPELIAAFPETWRRRVEELEQWRTLERLDVEGLDRTGIGAFYEDAMAYSRRAWEIHFEAMYPLAANYVGFQGICEELGIDPDRVATFLQGYDSKITESDRELWRLTRLAREHGLEAIFAHAEARELASILAQAPAAAAWWRELEAFLAVWGWRTEGIMDCGLAPWIEDPVSVLGTVKTFLQKRDEHDFETVLADVVAERERQIAEARATLTVEEQRTFDAALASCRAANFTWWNEEHNFYIDLRAHIPVRRAALALACLLEIEDPDDIFFVFSYEFRGLCRGDRDWTDLASLAAERRAWFEAWQPRRPSLPRVVGTLPEGVADPIVQEIYGMGRHYFAALEGEGDVERLEGLPAAGGVARGRARILLTAKDLHAIEPGEILVCEATSPSWTPAFTKIAACVCDVGGSLTHASIISREYRIPCVTACAIATTSIRTGDEIEVDGTNGVVKILSRA